MAVLRGSHECRFCEQDIPDGAGKEAHFWRCPFSKPEGSDRDKAVRDYDAGYCFGYWEDDQELPPDVSDAFLFGANRGSNDWGQPCDVD